MATKTFFGIADAHGIESFIPEEAADNSRRFILNLRANANRQRHAVSYQAVLDEEGAKEVEEKIKVGDFMAALIMLKLKAKEVRVESAQHEKSWKMIPNPDLDPYHTSED